MKPICQQIAAFGLSLLVVFSTLSFTLDLHYCGRHLVDVGINQEAHGCGMEQLASGLSDAGTSMDMGCCKNVQIAVDGQEELQTSLYEHTLEPPFALVPSPVVAAEPVLSDSREAFLYTDYSPPLLFRDLQVLHQTFRI